MQNPLKSGALRLSVFILLVFLADAALAQGPWTQRASLPGQGRHRGFTFVVGQRAYFGCGWNGVTMFNDFWEYDPGCDAWMQKSNYPGGPRLSPFGFAIGNKGYAGCGLNQNLVAQPDFYEYNPATNQWMPKANFIGAPIFGATAEVWNNTAIVMFGDEWAPSYWRHNEFYSYSATTNAWTYVGQFPGDGRRDHVSCNIGNKIYFGTGNDNSYAELNDWWEWDPGTGNLTPKATFIGSARSQAVGFAVNGKAYVGTGGLGDERDFFEYDPVTNSWQVIDEFAGSGRENAMTFVIGTRAFVVAGTSGINYTDNWEFNSLAITSTEELTSRTELEIFPNPATEAINIRLQNSFGKYAYQIYNISGQLTDESEGMLNGDLLQIPVNQLENGVYEVLVTCGGQRFHGRFAR